MIFKHVQIAYNFIIGSTFVLQDAAGICEPPAISADGAVMNHDYMSLCPTYLTPSSPFPLTQAIRGMARNAQRAPTYLPLYLSKLNHQHVWCRLSDFKKQVEGYHSPIVRFNKLSQDASLEPCSSASGNPKLGFSMKHVAKYKGTRWAPTSYKWKYFTLSINGLIHGWQGL